MNFLGIEEKFSSYENAKYVILPIGYDLTTTYTAGTRFGPGAIIEASQQIELLDEEMLKEAYTSGICTLDALNSVPNSPDEMMEIVEAAAKNIVKDDKYLIVLGGEHSITYPILKAVLEKEGSPISVLHFDAHSDLRDEYLGSKFNHACAARRICEIAPITQVGIRSFCSPDETNTATFPITQFKMHQIHSLSIDELSEKIISSLTTDKVYITFDLDVLDPSIMPAVGTPEPGGFLWYPILQLLKNVIQNKRVVGFDVVELCPIANFIAPDFLAARLVYKMITYIEYLKK